jgi:hypothetical protein
MTFPEYCGALAKTMSVNARFIDPMLLLKTDRLPEGSDLLSS